jgi:7-cyano-7-deazaguanine synthase
MPQRLPRTCLLVSGGLDSALLSCRLLRRGVQVHPLYVRFGLSWEATELYWLRRLLASLRCPRLAPLRVVELPVASLYGAHWSFSGRRVPDARSPDRAVYLPGRNVLLLSAAAIACARHRLSTIALGVLKGNPFGDASPRFFNDMERVLGQALGRPIRILAPIRMMSKVQLIRATPGVPLGLTFSCLRPRGRRHCGRCNKCAERRRAFQAAGLADPTAYGAA